MSNFFTPEFNNESAIAPWNASLEPTKAIIPQLDANRVLTGGVGQEVNIPTLTPEAYDNIILPDASLTRMASVASTDSNSSLPDSSVDLLTGQAMSEVYGDLSKFAADPDFAAKMNLAFGENWDAAAAKALAEGWFQGDFSDIPSVKVVSSAEIGGANGAFAAATDTIYLSKEFLAGNAGNPAAVADVLREEIGHSVDSRLNVTDSPGDEGAIFGAVVQGKELSEGELQGLKGEDDRGTVLFNGQSISIEKADFDIQNKWAIQAWNGNNNTDIWEPVSWSGRKTLGFGSNNRSDGKKGFAANWGDGSPGEGINKDNFLLGLWTQADFQQGQTYNFNVRADDNYALGAFPVGGNDAKQWEFIGGWKWNGDAFGGKTVQFTPKNNGKYWVLAYYREIANTAYFDISWEKVSNPISGTGTATKDNQSKTIEFKPVDRPLSDIANRPTWVITHGFNNDSADDKAQTLAKTIGNYQEGDQVLILDWGQAAKTGVNLSEAASWIEPVAEAAKRKLYDEWKIDPGNINLVGHSLGTYVVHEIAQRMPSDINRLIAIDPAAQTLWGYPKENNVDFRNKTTWSWGFYSSAFGNEKNVQNADESFRLEFSGAGIDENYKHGQAVYAVANLIKKYFARPDDLYPGTKPYFNLDNDMNDQAKKPWVPKDGFETTLSV
ncbi:hypothetical protein QUB53_08495 [Microcoleus sp. AT8-B4]|uniref:hypothetical protein n=1 Tax=Microcoleus sp. AT8-B4 TaxID=2818620 RepID=UPI002FD0563F